MAIYLGDDGSLDTIIECICEDCDYRYTLRYGDTSEYRDPDTGELDLDRFIEEVVYYDTDDEPCDCWED